MDPDQALRQLRIRVTYYTRVTAEENPLDLTDEEQTLELSSLASEFVDLVTGLDEWLSKGGFLPRPWQAKTDPPRPVPPGYRRVDDYSIEPLGPPDPAGVELPS